MKQSLRLLTGVAAVAVVLGAGIWIGRRSGQAPAPALASAPALAASSETAIPLRAAVAATPASSVSALPPTPSPETEANATALDQYFKTLNDANSAVHEVKSGDNLTRIAKQFGVQPGLLQAANQLKNDKIFPGQKLRIPKARWSLLINKDLNTLYLEADGTRIRSYPIATGKDRSTPEGTFKILNHLKNPTWYYEGKVVPPGSPENPLGTRWMGFDRGGYGLHGTSKPEEIGQFATLGCVRMLNEDIETLFEILPDGTEVTVVAQRV